MARTANADAAAAPSPGEPAEASPDPAASPPAVVPAPRPVNKLHEWGAAVVIMVALTLFLVIITRYLRGGGL